MKPGQRLIGVAVAVTALAACGEPKSVDQTSIEPLVERFSTEPVFWRQFELAKELATHREPRVLVALEPLLRHDDRHIRANAAFVFARLGDPRGLATIKGILADRSDRRLRQAIPTGLSNPGHSREWMPRQIREDRYYAVHMLGELRDRRAVDVLVSVLRDPDVNYHAAWALGLIGDARATAPLILALDDREALMRISAIQALQALGATEALPKLRGLASDPALPSAGDRVPVGEVAKTAIHRLMKEPWHTERFVVANDIKLHVLDWGGAGPNLVFVTGLGDPAYTFDSMALHFLKRFRVVALTRRGVLPSDQPQTGYDRATLTADVVHVLDSLQIRTAHLVGHSLGGIEITEIASRFPERVLSLVYLDAAIDAADAARVMTLDPMAAPPPSAESRAGQIAAWWSAYSPDYGALRSPALALFALQSRHPYVPPTASKALRQRADAYWTTDGRALVDRMAAKFKREARRGEVVMLKDASHHLYRDREIDVAVRMNEFYDHIINDRPSE
jgi:pimeloyl-ACP methyl ester carboxylesterase/HEAT repeat protein